MNKRIGYLSCTATLMLAVASSASTQSSFVRPAVTQVAASGSARAHADPDSPLPGDLLIADRGNSRLLIVTPDKRIVWQMAIPIKGNTNDVNSRGPDDAFFTPDGRHIIINEEENHQISIIDFATKKIVWTYGHSGVPGSIPGYLNTPDDAYMLPNGLISVADIKNQRILLINQDKQIVKQYGRTGMRYHNPPKSFAAPNGDTPLPGGGMIVTEIGGSYADRLDASGKRLFTVHFKDIAYPSDTQMLPNGRLMVVDYSTPGRVEQVTTKGDLVWEYYKPYGPGKLANPSLAIPLPNGDVCLNDDFNHRVIVIDPQTNQIVWQYGHTGVASAAPGYLNIPDGVDLVPPNLSLP